MTSDTRRLVIVWAVLIGLTALTGFAGRVTGQANLTVVFLALLGIVSMIKARLILAHYLDLRRAPGWNRAFGAVLYALIVLVYGLSVIPAFN